MADPLITALLLAMAALLYPRLVSPRRPGVGDGVALAALFTVFLPTQKLLLDGPTPPVQAVVQERRFDGVWFDPTVLAGVFVLSAAYNVARAWGHGRRRKLAK